MKTKLDHLDELVAQAEAHIAAHGHADPAFVLACAVEALAEQFAEDDRPLCRVCSVRRSPKGADVCGWCRDQAERLREHKRNTWARHGERYKATQRARAAGGGGGDDDGPDAA